MARRRIILAGVHPLGPALLSATATLLADGPVRVVPLRSFDLLAPATALAFAGPTRLVALGSDDVRLLDTATGALVHRLELPGRRQAARIAAGLVVAEPEARSAWLLSNRRSGAVLVEWTDERLQVGSEAPRVPWPGSPTGLRYAPGTNLVEGETLAGEGPLLGLAAGAPPLFVRPNGELVLGGQPETTVTSRLVGPTLASLWPGWFLASTARPPDEPDALLLLSGTKAEEEASWPAPGAIRCVAARVSEGTALVALVVELDAKRFRLVLLRLERSER